MPSAVSRLNGTKEGSNRGGHKGGTGEGNAKTKSYCPKHRGYKKRGVLIITGILITG
nr:MAG TPA: hypothetical protein [Caudoviricetes sp.]